ncbi:MAG TPA: nuclear transport factor 2 family protein [Candidatus Binatia bacterium]|nr:nuclear transport factor 2 family protein [Candidatus Binatia bacterium]
MHEDLLELERRFWEASSARDGDLIRSHVTDDALYAFPGSSGVWTKEDSATGVEQNPTPWTWFEIQQPRFIDIADGAVLLTYVSRSQHEGEEPFSMLVSSVYRATDDGWKLAFHQQTMASSD